MEIKICVCAFGLFVVCGMVSAASLSSDEAQRKSRLKNKIGVLVSPAEWNGMGLDQRLDYLSKIDPKGLATKREKNLYKRRLFRTAVLVMGRTIHDSLEQAGKSRPDLANLPELSTLLVQGGFLICDTLASKRYIRRVRDLAVEAKCITKKDPAACAAVKCADAMACTGVLFADFVAVFEPWARFSLGGVHVQIEGKDVFIKGVMSTIGSMVARNTPFMKIIEALAKSTDVSFIILKRSQKLFKQVAGTAV